MNGTCLAILRRLSPLLLAAACGWSVRAEPVGRAGAPQDPSSPVVDGAQGASTREDREAQALYVSHCGRCHEPFPPSHATAEAWPGLVGKYGPRARLFGSERQRVLRWLQARTGRSS